MAVSSKEITGFFFKKVGREKQRLSQLKKLLIKQLLKTFTGAGWRIRTTSSFPISHNGADGL